MPVPDTATLCMRTCPAVTSGPTIDDDRNAAPSRSRTRPSTCRSLPAPRTASAIPVGSRTVRAAIEERSSPRSTRPVSSVSRRPAPTTRTGSPAASATVVASDRRPMRIVSSPGCCSAAASAAAMLGCATQPATVVSTQNVAACASAGARISAKSTTIRLTTDQP